MVYAGVLLPVVAQFHRQHQAESEAKREDEWIGEPVAPPDRIGAIRSGETEHDDADQEAEGTIRAFAA